MTLVIKEWNKARQLEQIGVERNTGGFIIEDGQIQIEKTIDKPNTDYIIWEIEGCDRMKHTSIHELTKSNISIQKLIEERPESAEEYQAYLDENNEIITMINNM